MLRTALRMPASASAVLLAAGVYAAPATAASPCDSDQLLGLMQACQAWKTSQGANTVIEIVGSSTPAEQARAAAAALAPGAMIRVVPDLSAPSSQGIDVLDIADSSVNLTDSKIASLQALGTTVIAAAGDTGAKIQPPPAGIAEVSVVDAFGQALPKSDTGPQIALAGYGPDTATASGYVAAAAALVHSGHSAWTPRQLIAQLAATAHSITAESSHNDQSGYGVIHPLLAVTVDGPPDTTSLPGFDALFPAPAAPASPGSPQSSGAPAANPGGSLQPPHIGSTSGTKRNGTGPLLPVGAALLLVAAALLVLKKRRRAAEPVPTTPPEEWQPPQGPRHSGYGTPPE